MESLNLNNHIIRRPLYEIIKDIKQSLSNGKLNIVKSPLDNNVQVTCPNSNHKGGHESSPSGAVYTGPTTSRVKYGTYHCFSCDTTCSFEHFVAMCFDCSDEKAIQWLIDNYGEEFLDFEFDLPEIDLKKEVKTYLDESILDSFESFHPYMTQRKLTPEIISKFKIKYDPETKCLVFPVWDSEGHLIALSRRSVQSKTFILDKSMDKPLYLLNYIIKEHLTKAMITEGQIDCLTAWSYGFPCMGTMGSISNEQIALLNKSGIRVLYSMFDNDDAGKSFYKKLKYKLRKDILLINVDINIKNKKDINDLSKEEFENCVRQAENNCI